MSISGVIRRLGSFERDRICEHLLRLDDRDRHLRFGGHATSEKIRDHCAGLDLGRVVVLAYLVDDVVRSVGELTPLPGVGPRAAEVAISVERPFQGRGIGGALLRGLTRSARNRWIERLHMLCLLDNGRMVRLARGLDGQLSFEEGQIEATLDMPWPTAWTLLDEGLEEAAVWWAMRPGRAWPACGARSHRAPACAGGSSAA